MKEKYQNNIFKNTIIAIFTLILIVGAVCVVNVPGSHSFAADSVGNATPEGVDYLVEKHTNISDYRVKGALIAPTLSLENVSGEWLFAGWYTDAACKSALKSSAVCTTNAPMKDGTYYAKYVSADVLTVRCQISSNTTETSTSTVLRCVSSVDTLKYSKIGFDLTIPGNAEFAKNMESSKVGTRIKATNEEDKYSYSPKVVDTESEYFFSATYKMKVSDTENFNTEYFVKPYWITQDGTKVYGSGRYLSVNAGLKKDIIHVPVKMDEPAENETFTTESATGVTLLSYDESTGYAHFKLTVADRTKLKSVTKLAIKNGSGEAVGTGDYRNLLTRFTGNGTDDASWYNSTEDEFVIATSADLYGLITTVNNGNNLSGKEVYVVSDIEVNKGTAKESGWEPAEGITTIYSWFPINNFAGTFDGQGHSISGLKCIKDSQWSGFFQATQSNAVVKDLRLVNSYFESTYSNGQAWLGSVAGYAVGTFESIYSNAIVVSKAPVTGGLLGGDNVSADVKVIDCWFDGKVKSTGAYATGGIIGLVQAGGKTEVQKCLNTGSVSGVNQVAGICGLIAADDTTVNIIDSINTGEVKGNTACAELAVQGESRSTVTVTNSYCTSKNSRPSVSQVNSNMGTLNNQARQYPEANLKGVVAQQGDYDVELDFTNDWAMQCDSAPILRSFIDLKQSDKDISWYNATAETMKIDSVADLKGFSYVANTGNKDFAGQTIQLTKDIVVNEGKAEATGWTQTTGTKYSWSPIKNFAGTFDGQGHSISGICSEQTTQYNGFFGATTDKAVVKDFRLMNSYFSSTQPWVGSIAGIAAGTFQSVYSDAIVAGNTARRGGLFGGENTSSLVEISNCWFAGTVESSSSYATGGIIGSVETGETKIQNCLNTGIIKGGSNVAGICGLVGANTSLTITDCLGAGTITGSSRAAAVVATQANTTPTINISNTYCTSECHTNPEFGTTSVVVKKYAEANFKGVLAQDVMAVDFKNNWVMQYNDVPILHSFIDLGKQSDVDISWYDVNATTMTIDSLAALKGFSYIANDSNKTFEGKTVQLTTDIIVNEGKAETTGWTSADGATTYPWTPIKNFAGTFDGQGHSISGICSEQTTVNNGFFGATTDTAVVKDFRLTNSYFSSTQPWVGSIAGKAAGTFETIYSNAIVVGDVSRKGGLFGGEDTSNSVDISDCWFDGTVTQNTISSFSYGTGGIIGTVENGQTNIQNSLNTGRISACEKVAGICGLVAGGGTQLTIKDSMNYGDVTNHQLQKAAFVVHNAVTKNTVIIKNSYCKNSLATVWQYDNNAGATLTDEGKKYPEANLKGVVAQVGDYGVALDFTNDWVMQPDSVPILRSFIDLGQQSDIDISWYDATAKTMQIDSLPALKGFNYVANTGNRDFAGQTIQLTKDIVVNEGKAEATGWTQTAGTKYSWTPIKSFAGTFDGQKHSISGICSEQTTQYNGFFGATTDKAVVKDFRLMNSYFSSTQPWVGSIAGIAAGTFQSVYSDAIVAGNTARRGGLFGGENTSSLVEISNCWFAGTVESSSSYATGGIIGSVEKGETKIQNCLNTGIIKGGSNVAGICGLAGGNDATLRITNCLGAGTIAQGAPAASVVATQNSTTPTVIISNTYCTSESHTNPEFGTTSVVVEQYAEAKFKGVVDKNSIKLDFTNDWAMQYNDVPILRSFIDLSKQGIIDHSWYDAILSISNVEVSSPAIADAGTYYVTVTEIDGTEYESYLTAVQSQGFVQQSKEDSEKARVAVYLKGDMLLTVSYYTELSKSYISYSVNTLYQDWTGVELFDALPTMEGTSDIVDYGAGNYVVTKEGTKASVYDAYLEQLNNDGFDEYAANSINSNVYTATYTKQNLVVTVTHLTESNMTYISASKDQPLSEHLQYQDVYVAGNTESAQTKLHFMEQWRSYGNSFVIQLKNGHFIINDGGHHNEVDYLVDYLEELAGKDAEGNQIKPVIEAWFISHAHIDHYGALRMFCENPEYGKRVYVEGIYYNEPSNNVIALDSTARDHITFIRKVTQYLQTTGKDNPEIYRTQTGQRYYFNDITVDIVLAQEQIPFKDLNADFNETSTWCMFNIEGKKCLIGGDGDDSGMKFMMNTYDPKYLEFDVFSLLHHGDAASTVFANHCEFGIVLVTKRGYTPNDISEYANYALKAKAADWLLWDNGTQVLTFSDEGILVKLADKFDWQYHNGEMGP